MAKKGTKVQIVDLGTHFVKAALLECQGGTFPIVKAAAVPLKGNSSDADGHLSEFKVAFGDLVDFFDKKVPIHFVLPESIIRVGISYLNNLTTDGVEAALAAETQKFASASGISQFDLTVSRSHRLREKTQGKNTQVVVGNVLARNENLDAIAEMLIAKKLTVGSYFPRLFALRELFRVACGDTAASLVACLVDIGFTSTSVVAFKDTSIVFHKMLHLGGIDFFKELTELEQQGKYKMDLPEFAAIMATQGFSDSDANLTAMGLPISSPTKYVEAILGQVDQLFTKVQLSIDYFSTVAATDFNTSMSTVMAVRKGPELIAFTGGLAKCSKFTELVTQYFGKSAVLLDTSSVAPMNVTAEKTELDAHFFAGCVGGAALATSDEGAQFGLATDTKGKPAPKATGSAGAESSADGEQAVPSWAVLLFVAVAGWMGFQWWELTQSLKKLQIEAGAKSGQLSQARDIITAYRAARTSEIRIRTQLDLIEELMKNRVPWGQFFQDLTSALPEDVRISRITIDTQLPESDNPEALPKPKTTSITFCGESRRRPGVTELVTRLIGSKRFIDLAPPDTVQAGEGTGLERGPCTDPEPVQQKLERHTAFQVSGKLSY